MTMKTLWRQCLRLGSELSLSSFNQPQINPMQLFQFLVDAEKYDLKAHRTHGWLK